MALSVLSNKSVVGDMREELNALMQKEVDYYEDQISESQTKALEQAKEQLQEMEEKYIEDDTLRNKVLPNGLTVPLNMYFADSLNVPVFHAADGGKPAKHAIKKRKAGLLFLVCVSPSSYREDLF